MGFARAVSDGVSFAFLADVFVLPAHRGRGLGKRLVAAMIDEGPGADFRWALFTGDAHGLYEQFGFAAPDATAMVRPARRGAQVMGAARRHAVDRCDAVSAVPVPGRGAPRDMGLRGDAALAHQGAVLDGAGMLASALVRVSAVRSASVGTSSCFTAAPERGVNPG